MIDISADKIDLNRVLLLLKEEKAIVTMQIDDTLHTGEIVGLNSSTLALSMPIDRFHKKIGYFRVSSIAGVIAEEK